MTHCDPVQFLISITSLGGSILVHKVKVHSYVSAHVDDILVSPVH